MNAAIRLWIFALCAAGPWLALACGGGATSEVSSALRRGELDLALRLYDAQGGRDPGSLVAIAEVVLLREADSGDPRRSAQAFAALRAIGTAASSGLERLAERSERALVRARALELLAALGDADARAALRAQLDAADSEVAAAAVSALDPQADLAALLARLDSPAAAVRIAAIRRLAHAAPAPETLDALDRSAQHDPERSARLGALTALARQGKEGVDAIEARLGDPDAEVRAAAAALLVSADHDRARQRLAPLLAGDVSVEGIEAARALLAADAAHEDGLERSVLTRSLAHADPGLRGRAAVALMSLRDPQLQAPAAARAAHEPLRGARLCLVLSLGPEHPARAKLLRELMNGDDVAAVQASAELARLGDGPALAALQRHTADADTAVRRAAVNALGRELGRGHDVRAALRDADASVRIAAAAAIVGASGRSGTS